MDCYVSGFIGLAFLGASVATLTASNSQIEVLRKTLSPELADRYAAIANERAGHYIQGLLLGMVLSYAVLYKTRISNTFHKTSLFFAVTLSAAVIYYFLMPKSDYMLKHLKTPEQNKAWLSIYKTMKARYFIGLVLGAIASIPFANAFC